MTWILLKIILIEVIIVFHTPIVLRFAKQVAKRNIPNTVDFGAMSVVIYYDIGFLAELLGIPYQERYLQPVLDRDPIVLIAIIAMVALTPWLFYLGAHLINPKPSYISQISDISLKKGTVGIFLVVAVVVSGIFAYLSYGFAQQAESTAVWDLAAQSDSYFNLLSLLPTAFLAFYIRHTNARSKWGIVFIGLLVVLSLLPDLITGRRFRVLLAPAIIILFYNRLTVRSMVIAGIGAVIVAAALLPLFRSFEADNPFSVDLIYTAIYRDFYRAPLAAFVLQYTELAGTKLLPYPMYGYVYSLLFYMPRALFPFKGLPTNFFVTAAILNRPVGEVTYGFGGGAIEELLVNGGFLALMFGLPAYGAFMGLLDRWSSAQPALVVPARIAGFWVCGYQLSTLIAQYGTMFIFILLLTLIFGGYRNQSTLPSVPESERQPHPAFMRTENLKPPNPLFEPAATRANRNNLKR